MALFMDIHELPEGAGAKELEEAHAKDVAVQDKYGVNYKNYWVDEKDHKAFCLVEAPDAETAAKVHREAHGLEADQIFEVIEGM
jgi:leucyl aminopeptidase (aminopeptidase T)